MITASTEGDSLAASLIRIQPHSALILFTLKYDCMSQN